MNPDDNQLLREYVRNASDEAFTELVHRYVDLVWTAAWRVTRDVELARDVAQTVFADLARKAPSLPPTTILAGWLHRAAFLAASKVVRTNTRRAQRETQAMQLHFSTTNPAEQDQESQELMPLLDEALGNLGDADRNAVVLRFFAKKNFTEIGAALGLSDDTAQKRLSRALEKLRKHFRRRGYAISAGSLASALALAGGQAAPAGMAATVAISSLAVAGTAAASTGLLSTLINIPTQIAAMKTTIALASLAVVTVSTPLLIQQHSLNELRAENQNLAAQAASLDDLREERAALLRSQNFAAELEMLISMEEELLRLRQEAEQLRQTDLDSRLALQQQLEAATALLSQSKTRADQVEREIQYVETQMEVSETMKNLGLATRIWANDNEGLYPPTLRDMTNELGSDYVIAELENRYEFVPRDRPVDESQPRALLFREKEPRPTPDGRWMRLYTLGDGSVQYVVLPDPLLFSDWERNYELRAVRQEP